MSAIELKPFCHEAELALASGTVLRLTINFRAIDRLEGLLGKGMDEIIGELASSAAMAVKFLWGVTREHHSELSLDQLAAIVFSKADGPKVQAMLGHLVKQAFNLDDGAREGEQSRPPRKGSSGTSRASSRSGARRG